MREASMLHNDYDNDIYCNIYHAWANGMDSACISRWLGQKKKRPNGRNVISLHQRSRQDSTLIRQAWVRSMAWITQITGSFGSCWIFLHWWTYLEFPQTIQVMRKKTKNNVDIGGIQNYGHRWMVEICCKISWAVEPSMEHHKNW